MFYPLCFFQSEAALAYDALTVFTGAVQVILQTEPDTFRNNFRRGQVYNYKQRGVSCAIPGQPWEKGSLLLSHYKNVSENFKNEKKLQIHFMSETCPVYGAIIILLDVLLTSFIYCSLVYEQIPGVRTRGGICSPCSSRLYRLGVSKARKSQGFGRYAPAATCSLICLTTKYFQMLSKYRPGPKSARPCALGTWVSTALATTPALDTPHHPALRRPRHPDLGTHRHVACRESLLM